MWWTLLTTALAADWVMLQATEPAGKEELRPFGFVQGLGEGIAFARPVDGLEGAANLPYEGQRPAFNLVGSREATWGFGIRRARAGLRGAAPGTDGRVAFAFAAELGDNGLTRVDPVLLTDASVTLSYVPGVRLRIGQFKLPLGEEALEMNPNAAEFINFSSATGQLLLESQVTDGQYTSGVGGFRDIGVQAFETFPVGRGELSYAVMLSNGRMGALDDDDHKDLTARLAFTPWIGADAGKASREELGFYAFAAEGKRLVDVAVDGEAARRARHGAGVKLEYDGWHARVEALRAVGVIVAPSAFVGQPVTVLTDGQAWGGHAYAHWQPGPLGGGLRYDLLRRGEGADLRQFQTLTVDAQWRISPNARVQLDYEARWLAAPEGSADAQRVAAAMGDRVSGLVTVVF